MRRFVKIAAAISAVIALVAAGVAWYLGPIAPIATGYAAKTLCSAIFVADRPPDTVAGDLPGNPLVPYLRTDVDESEGRLSASLLGLWPTTAWFTPGLGCTLAEERPAFTPVAQPPVSAEDEPWPTGNAPVTDVGELFDEAALEAAIDLAFVEDDPEGRRRNTRAVVVVKDGALVAERYGDGFGPDTPLLGWSMTKSVGSAIVGRLVHEGVMTLDDADLREEWRGDDRSDITVEQLMTMTNGLAFVEDNEVGDDVTTMLYRPRDMAAYAADQPLEATPGTRYSYSSGSTNLLCRAAHEAAAAGPEMAQDLVFTPLGMSSAVMEPDAAGGLACSSFMYATARDWARFGQWFLQDGMWDGHQLLPDGWVEEATTPVTVASDDAPYGRGWWLNEGPGGSLRMPSVPADAFWASGHEGQQTVVVPSEGLVVVRLGFSGAFSGVQWGLEPMLSGIIAATR